MTLEQRRLGRTGHSSSVAILGTAAFGESTPEVVRASFDLALAEGINHVDIAPSYGRAEELLGPLLPPVRDRVFLACKTMERTADAARAELESSLSKLRTDAFDLYQFHAVIDDDELDRILAPGGAGEAVISAREEGLVHRVGITGHFGKVPHVILRALQTLDLDTVMFPINVAMWCDREYRAAAEEVLELCAERDLGVMAIKAAAFGYWHATRTHTTWYRPLVDAAAIQESVNFVLSLPVTSFATPGDTRLLPIALEAARNFRRLSPKELEQVTPPAGAEALLSAPPSPR